jgi:tetratricopeptide (TPR) repeat protein
MFDVTEEIKSQNSLRIIQQLFRKNPKNPEVLFHYANVLLKSGQAKKAVTILKKLKLLEPNRAGLHYAMALAYAELGQKSLWNKSLKKELELNPFSMEAAWYLGRYYYDLEEWEKAILYLNWSFSLNHDQSYVMQSLAWCYIHTGRPSKERELYEDWLIYHPEDSWVLNNLGVMFLNWNQPFRARLHFLKALKSDPEDLLTRENLAKANKLCHL